VLDQIRGACTILDLVRYIDKIDATAWPPAGHLSQRLILRSAEPEHQVFEYANSFQWTMIVDIPEDPDVGQQREVVWRISSTIDLHYQMDDMTGIGYVFIRADHPRQEDSFAAHAEQHLDVFPREELLRTYDMATDPEERGGSLLMLALGAPFKVDEATALRISAALQGPHPDVREAAIYATSYTPSEAYIPLLRHVAETDPVEALREDAQVMLDSYDEVGIGQ
jgi:hypothetical protein